MTNGIKVAKEGSDVDSTDPRNITLDSRQAGAMKIAKKIIFKQDPTHPTFTANGTSTTNTIGVNYGTYKYEHKLGFAPAFTAYRLSVYNYLGIGHKDAIILPTFGAFGQDLQSVISDTQFVTVTNIIFGSGSTDYWVVLYIFEEDLDATV